jgi:glycosyltransferase involved in cell wall biosynthesis
MYYQIRLRDIVKSEKLEDSITFTGPRKDVSDIVNCITVLIHASIEPEPFGRTLLEGMALRKPIISTRIGAPLEIVIDGKTGILIEPGKPEAMAAAIMKILSDRRLAEEMGSAGYERLLAEFNLKKNVELTENLYAAVLT